MVLPIRESGVDMAGIIAFLQSCLPDDAILTNGAGNFAIWHNKFFCYSSEARLLAPQSGAMGYGLPAAIAAKAEHPERLVLCFAGDGDFQMNMQELGTAMQAGAQPIVIVVNNGVYGTIRMHQERDYPNRQSFTAIENPDFCAIAKAYGFHAETVRETAAFPEAFTRAAASTTGALIELIVDPEFITPKATLSQIRG
jgi:acetolactate synthase-1/2/3 large subunit